MNIIDNSSFVKSFLVQNEKPRIDIRGLKAGWNVVMVVLSVQDLFGMIIEDSKTHG
jgi:hypothetical protein